METPLLARSPFLLLGWLRNTMRTRPAIDHRIDRISASSIEAARWPTVVTNNIVPIINATAVPPLPPSHADPDDPLVYTPVSRNFRFGMNGVDAIGIEGRLFNSGIITKERTVE